MDSEIPQCIIFLLMDPEIPQCIIFFLMDPEIPQCIIFLLMDPEIPQCIIFHLMDPEIPQCIIFHLMDPEIPQCIIFLIIVCALLSDCLLFKCEIDCRIRFCIGTPFNILHFCHVFFIIPLTLSEFKTPLKTFLFTQAFSQA